MSQHNRAVPRVLPPIVWSLIVLSTIIWLYLIYYLIFKFKMGTGPEVVPAFAWSINVIKRVAGLLISISAIYVLVQSRTRSSFYYALFIVFISAWDSIRWLVTSNTLSENWYYVYSLAGIICFVITVRMSQEFPSHINVANIARVYYKSRYWKFMTRPLCWLLKSYRTWIFFLLVQLASFALSPNSMFTIGSAIPLFFAICYIVVQLRTTSAHSKNQLYWIIWVLFCIFFIITCTSYFSMFGINMSPLLGYILHLLGYLPLIFAIVITVFFSDLLDARLILRKTLLYGLLFLFIMFLFGTVEHLIIHELSHQFHFNEVYIASAFAAGIGMLVHPVKEKLTHWLKKIDKK